MPETPFQFRHQGQVAGLRTTATPAEHRELTPEATSAAPPRPRPRAWGWLAVPCMTVAVAVPWLMGIDARSFGPAEISLPGSSVPIVEDGVGAASSASVEDDANAVMAPTSAQRVVEPVVSTAEPAGGAQRVVTPASREPAKASRSRPLATPSPARPRTLQIDLSIVKVRYLDGRLAPAVTRALAPALPAIRRCIAPILHRQPELRGTVTATLSARDGKFSAVNVESEIRHTQLRFCFRQALMSRSVIAGVAETTFDARVEFFVLPRVIR